MLRRIPTCLVVEPEKGMRDLLDDLLSVSDVTVIAAASDQEALRHLTGPDTSKIDVVLCPAPAPGSKGSLVSRIRANDETKLRPVICLSHSNGLQDRAVAHEAGCTEYMLRPVSPVELADRVRHWSTRTHVPY